MMMMMYDDDDDALLMISSSSLFILLSLHIRVPSTYIPLHPSIYLAHCYTSTPYSTPSSLHPHDHHQIHFMDPEDLLAQTPQRTAGLIEIPGLGEHFQDNRLALELLANHSLSFRY